MMKGAGDEHTRLCVMESMFIDFQRHMKDHVDMEENELNELKCSQKENTSEILNHIDMLKRESASALAENRVQLLELLEREYVSEAKVDQKITNMRVSIIKDIKESRGRTLREAGILFFGISITVIVCAWIYVNLVKI